MEGLRKRVLIGVSGGPDSMALLDMMKDRYEVYVAHVNYHHRDTALRDDVSVEDSCTKYDIPYFKKDYVEVEGGNFQENARIFIYEFYKEIIDKYDLECVMLAHHKDDLIETYLMQKKRNSHVYYYGLKRSVKNFWNRCQLKVFWNITGRMKLMKSSMSYRCMCLDVQNSSI